MTDAARNQAVYVDEHGASIDIVSQEPDGSTVAGTEAVGLAVISDSSGQSSQGSGSNSVSAPSESRASAGSNGEDLRAIVIGARSDGAGGVWVVLANRLVLPAGKASGSGNSSSLPECDDRNNGMHGWMGWTYIVTGISDDGKMIVGNAINKKGFHHGGITIDPGTTVGVYWWVTRIPHRPWISISSARVIGRLDTSKLPNHKGRWKKWLDSRLFDRLAHLQLFFLDYFSSYLSEANSVSYDLRRSLYIVTGKDQDGNDATATIDRKNTIVITATTPPSTQADLTVSSIQVPSTAQTTSATWTLGATVVNSGTDNAGSFTILYQLSTKGVLDASATTIGTSTVTSLAAGGTYTDTWSTSYSIPQGGTHWIFVTADSTNAVAESNESNNTAGVSVPITYPRVLIETYNPNTAFTSPFISLFGPNGDTTADTSPNEWNDDNPPYTMDTGVAIAESGTTGTWASIDYEGGLPPGTYYVRVRGAQSYQKGAYAIRFLSLNVGDPLPAYTTFGSQNTTDAPYEPDDALQSGTGIPANPVAVGPGSVVNRYLQVNGDMDWFVLTLP